MNATADNKEHDRMKRTDYSAANHRMTKKGRLFFKKK